MNKVLVMLTWLSLIPGAWAAQNLQPTNPARSYSAGMVTEGGRFVWLAGMGGTRSADGTKIDGIEAQTRQAFRNIEACLLYTSPSPRDS